MSNYCKKIISFTLVAIITCVFLLNNVSFATSSNAIFNDGNFFIKNCHTKLYLAAWDSNSVVQSDFNGLDEQAWEFTHVSNGYYRIRNTSTNYYLTAPDDDSCESHITMEYLYTSTTMLDRQLWKFDKTDGVYKVQAKSMESYDLLMSSGGSIGTYGYEVFQDLDYSDE